MWNVFYDSVNYFNYLASCVCDYSAHHNKVITTGSQALKTTKSFAVLFYQPWIARTYNYKKSGLTGFLMRPRSGSASKIILRNFQWFKGLSCWQGQVDNQILTIWRHYSRYDLLVVVCSLQSVRLPSRQSAYQGHTPLLTVLHQCTGTLVNHQGMLEHAVQPVSFGTVNWRVSAFSKYSGCITVHSIAECQNHIY